MKNQVHIALSALLTVALCSSLLSMSSLIFSLRSIKNFVQNKEDVKPGRYPWELVWNSSKQVTLEFNNIGGFHITSDKDWQPYSQPRIFRLEPQSSQEYIISMEQQLYCLNKVRFAYLSYHTERPRLSDAFYNEAEICIEQLRQHLMCHTDITLEPTKLHTMSDGTKVPGTKGVGVLHRCQDWQLLESTITML